MSGSGSGSSSGQNAVPKAIGSLAKKQDDVTRQGTTKMKFVPTLPARRKKEDSKPETKPESATLNANRGGRGRGRGRGRGDGRGGAPYAPPEMVASGPFALGPAMAGTSARRTAPRSNFAPLVPLGSASSSSLGAGLTKSTAPSLKRDPHDDGQKATEEDAYSDPDEGVEIVDIDDVRRMDWMAPESLRKEKVQGKKKKVLVKREEEASKGKGKVKAETEDVDLRAVEEDDDRVNLANALDLSESEEEEEMEDLINDFALQEEDLDADVNTRQEKLYFFQFPEPFPTFLPRQQPQVHDIEMADAEPAVDKGKAPEGSEKTKKAVSFAPDVKPAASGESTPVSDVAKDKQTAPPAPLDGVIGRLEIHQSGAVRMRLENGILLDVTAATQPSFLQHAMHIDLEKKRLNVLGEVNRRFIVSPNIDALLESLEISEQQAAMGVDNKLDDSVIKLEQEKGKGRERKKK